MPKRKITGRMTITEPGTYTFARDFKNGGGTRLSEPFLRIKADDVVIDGNDHILAGNGVSDTTGILALNAENVTIKNLTIRRWDYGIRFEDVIDGAIRNTRVVKNGYGVSFENSTMAFVTGCRIENNVLGVFFDLPSSVFPWDNTITSNVGRDLYRSPTPLE